MHGTPSSHHSPTRWHRNGGTGSAAGTSGSTILIILVVTALILAGVGVGIYFAVTGAQDAKAKADALGDAAANTPQKAKPENSSGGPGRQSVTDTFPSPATSDMGMVTPNSSSTTSTAAPNVNHDVDDVSAGTNAKQVIHFSGWSVGYDPDTKVLNFIYDKAILLQSQSCRYVWGFWLQSKPEVPDNPAKNPSFGWYCTNSAAVVSRFGGKLAETKTSDPSTLSLRHWVLSFASDKVSFVNRSTGRKASFVAGSFYKMDLLSSSPPSESDKTAPNMAAPIVMKLGGGAWIQSSEKKLAFALKGESGAWTFEDDGSAIMSLTFATGLPALPENVTV